MGTEMVLKAAARYRCRVLIASTSEVYGKGSRIPFSEEDDVLLGATRSLDDILQSVIAYEQEQLGA